MSLLFVGASWLIEQRYAIIPMALLLALREPERDAAERITVALWAPLAVWIALGMLDHQFVL
jgi:alpha-1,2-glucosyltransferase